MPEDQQPVAEEKPVERPQSFQEFFKAYFLWFIALAAAIFVYGTARNSAGETYLTMQQMGYGYAVLFVVFFLIPYLVFFKKKAERVSEITPVNPLEEIPLLQEQFARIGRDVHITRVESDPFEGEGAGQPEVYHYQGFEVLADGTRKPFSVAQGGITKFATKFGNQRYIETHTFSAAGTRKRPTEPGPRQVQPLVVSRPAPVQFIIPERKPVGGEEKEKKEEEEEEE